MYGEQKSMDGGQTMQKVDKIKYLWTNYVKVGQIRYLRTNYVEVGQNKILVDKNIGKNNNSVNEIIEQKLLLLTCIGEDPRCRSVITRKSYLYIHKCAVICTTKLKQIFDILIDVEPKNNVGYCSSF